MLNNKDINKIPTHIAVIMDGNGRWAKEHKLPRVQGHKKGVDSLLTVAKAAEKRGVKYLTFYAFSSENWSRPKEEIDALMSLLLFVIKKYKKTFIDNKIRFNTIGDISKLPLLCRKAIEKMIDKTKDFKEFTITLALNYGSRNELEYAVKAMIKDAKEGKIDESEVDYAKISSYFYTKDIPDPDLIIRTSGEYRLSNYLMMQAAYAEFYFTQRYWPDFGEEDLNLAIDDFSMRNRRFGKTQEQI